MRQLSSAHDVVWVISTGSKDITFSVRNIYLLRFYVICYSLTGRRGLWKEADVLGRGRRPGKKRATTRTGSRVGPIWARVGWNILLRTSSRASRVERGRVKVLFWERHLLTTRIDILCVSYNRKGGFFLLHLVCVFDVAVAPFARVKVIS